MAAAPEPRSLRARAGGRARAAAEEASDLTIINGKKLYKSRKLRQLALEGEGRAADAYLWLLGLADDWGRFEADARGILGKAYKNRPDVSEADVARWLDLFESVRVEGEDVGLVRFYTIDGVRWGEWTAWAGASPSQRTHHSCPEPPWTDHQHTDRCKLWGAARETRAQAAEEPTRSRDVPSRPTPRSTPTGSPETYTSVPLVPPRTDPPQTPLDDEGGEDRGRIRVAAQVRKRRRAAPPASGSAEDLIAFAQAVGLRTDRPLRRRIREALREGTSPERIRQSLEDKAPPPRPPPPSEAPTLEALRLWQAVRDRVRPQVLAATWDTWLRPTEGYTIEPGSPRRLVVGVPRWAFAQYLEAHEQLGELVKAAAAAIAGEQLEVVYHSDLPGW